MPSKDKQINYTHSQKNKFEEERARLLLIHLFGEKYRDSVLSESPDIVNHSMSIGVEVTSAMKAKIQEAMSRAGVITGKREEELQDRERKIIKSNNQLVLQ